MVESELHELGDHARARPPDDGGPEDLLAAIPAEAKASGSTPAEYLDSLRPATADQVAVAQFEGG